MEGSMQAMFLGKLHCCVSVHCTNLAFFNLGFSWSLCLAYTFAAADYLHVCDWIIFFSFSLYIVKPYMVFSKWCIRILFNNVQLISGIPEDFDKYVEILLCYHCKLFSTIPWLCDQLSCNNTIRKQNFYLPFLSQSRNSTVLNISVEFNHDCKM